MAAPTESAPTRLLVVDDEAALREPLADYLVRQGFVVTQAATAAEARGHLAAGNARSDLCRSIRPQRG